MSALWIAAVTGWLLAAAAFVTARRTARRVRELTEMYWELKYSHGELNGRVRSLAGDEPPPAASAPPTPVQGFVPIGDLKRKS